MNNILVLYLCFAASTLCLESLSLLITGTIKDFDSAKLVATVFMAFTWPIWVSVILYRAFRNA